MNLRIQEVFLLLIDQVLKDVTDQVGGIRLYRNDTLPSGEVCTMHATFEGGYHATLVLCAELPLLTRLAQRMLQQEHVSAQDIEDLAKEYFNVICGHIAVGLFRAEHISSRFSVPHASVGSYTPEKDTDAQSVLNYVSDQNENAQIIHCVLNESKSFKE